MRIQRLNPLLHMRWKGMDSLLDLMKVPTAPGHEDLVAAWIGDRLSRLKIPFRKDRHGNLVAEIRSGDGKRPIAFAAHMDHPGFSVIECLGKRVECVFRGGVPRDWFVPGVKVDLFDRGGRVVAQAQVERILRWESKKILLRTLKGSAANAVFGMWKLPALRIDRKRSRVIGRACDDLAGCAAILATLAELVKKRSSVHVYAVFTRREEIGLEGAFEVARSRILPKSASVISIETSKALSNAPQGGGPILRVGDRSSIFDSTLTHQLRSIGERLQKSRFLVFQRKLMDGGTCEATAFLESGRMAGGLCVALANYHNCSVHGRIVPEDIHLGDWRQLVQWMVEIPQSFRKN